MLKEYVKKWWKAIITNSIRRMKADQTPEIQIQLKIILLKSKAQYHSGHVPCNKRELPRIKSFDATFSQKSHQCSPAKKVGTREKHAKINQYEHIKAA